MLRIDHQKAELRQKELYFHGEYSIFWRVRKYSLAGDFISKTDFTNLQEAVKFFLESAYLNTVEERQIHELINRMVNDEDGVLYLD